MLLATQQQHNALRDLPFDALGEIGSYLGNTDLSAMSLTSCDFYDVAIRHKTLLLNDIRQLDNEDFRRLALEEKEGQKIRPIKLDLPNKKTNEEMQKFKAFLGLHPKIVSVNLDISSRFAYLLAEDERRLWEFVGKLVLTPCYEPCWIQNINMDFQPLVDSPAFQTVKKIVDDGAQAIADILQNFQPYVPTIELVMLEPEDSLSNGKN